MYIYSCTFFLLSCELKVVLVDTDDLTYKHLPSTDVSGVSIKGLFQDPVLAAKLVKFTGLEEFIEMFISEVKCFHHPLNLPILFFGRLYLGILSLLLLFC